MSKISERIDLGFVVFWLFMAVATFVLQADIPWYAGGIMMIALAVQSLNEWGESKYRRKARQQNDKV